MQEMTPEQKLNRETFSNIQEKILDITCQLSALSTAISTLIETSPNPSAIYESLNIKCQTIESSLGGSDEEGSAGRKLLARISSTREVALQASLRQQ